MKSEPADRLIRLSVGGFGLLVGIAMLYPISLPGGHGLRVTDLVNLSCACIVVWTIISTQSTHLVARTFGIVSLLSLAWIAAELQYGWYGDSRLTVILLRWLTGLFTAYWLVTHAEESRTRRWITVGMIVGGSLALSSLLMDPNGGDPNAMHDAVHTRDVVWSGDTIRGTGIFDHPNAAAAAVLLLVPLILSAASEWKLPSITGLLALVPIMIVFQVTQTRSASAIAALIVAYWFIRRVRMSSFIGVLAFILLIAMVTVPGMAILGNVDDTQSGRLTNTQEAASNASDRLRTVLASLDISMENPFGLGSSYMVPLKRRTGYEATHNAYLELSLLGGLALAGYVTFLLWRTAATFFTSDRLEGMLAIYISGVFFYENLLSQPQMLILCLWLLWRPRVGSVRA